MKFFQAFLNKPKSWVWVAIVLFFAITIPTSTSYTTADEHFWLPNLGEERVLDYWRELLKGDFEDTAINDKPGVTLAYLSGIAIPFTQHLYEAHRTDYEGELNKIRQYDPEITKVMHFAYRLPIILFTGFFTLYFFWILQKITKNEYASALSVIFILLSPVLLGISQIVNPDTTFWVFGLASMLTFIAYAQYRTKKFALFTTLFLGLSLASKYVSVIFFPFFLLILGCWYLFSQDKRYLDQKTFSAILTKDIYTYYGILLGSTVLFSLMMPASIVDPEILYESTIGFPGMLPIFVVTVILTLLVLLDAFFLKSKIVFSLLTFLRPHTHIIERSVYGILLLSTLFVLFNWVSKNSLVDLSDIPYYAKTKESFTTDNPYIVRYIMQFVPLVFALTPLTLFLLIFFWTRAFFLENSQRFFTFILSMFFVVFYIAVVEQGLLVTVRYSIILFPLALILASIGLIDLLYKKTPPTRWTPLWVSGTFAIPILAFAGIQYVYIHENADYFFRRRAESIVGTNEILIAFVATVVGTAIGWLLWKYSKKIIEKITPQSFTWIALVCIVISGLSLRNASPHFFLYMNDFLHTDYVLNNPWGYGGYEAAQYLNNLPDAENLTLWANAHGVCEFFVGKCIMSQKLDITTYKVDYLFYAHRGSLATKFETAPGKTVFEYFPDKRETNYVRIKKNDPDKALQQMRMKSEEVEML
jgi:4-amino-4-deoxy-L-arabinose transferase-like glycosyltransferase